MAVVASSDRTMDLLGGDMVKIDLKGIQHYKAQDERV
jgi:hypothetical protein